MGHLYQTAAFFALQDQLFQQFLYFFWPFFNSFQGRIYLFSSDLCFSPACSLAVGIQ